MISKSTLFAATTLIAAIALPSTTALAAHSTSYPAAKRPHSRVVTYDRGDVLVRRLQLELKRADHRLHGEIRLSARNETGHTIDHGTTFRAKARGVGIAPYARRVLATRPGRAEGSQTVGRRAARKLPPSQGAAPRR